MIVPLNKDLLFFEFDRPEEAKRVEEGIGAISYDWNSGTQKQGA